MHNHVCPNGSWSPPPYCASTANAAKHRPNLGGDISKQGHVRAVAATTKHGFVPVEFDPRRMEVVRVDGVAVINPRND